MALGPKNWSCPVELLGGHPPGRKEEEGPRLPEVAVHRSGGRSRDRRPGRPQVRNKCPRPQKGSSGSCPVHPNGRHSAAECHKIIDLAKCVSERREQSSKDGSSPRRWPDKEKVDDGEVVAAERDLGYQSPEGDLKDIFAGGSYSGENN
jgi:hypothetical protein